MLAFDSHHQPFQPFASLRHSIQLGKKFKKSPADKLILITVFGYVFVFAGVSCLLSSTATPHSLRAASPVLGHFLLPFFNPVLYEAVDSRTESRWRRRAPKRLDGSGTRLERVS